VWVKGKRKGLLCCAIIFFVFGVSVLCSRRCGATTPKPGTNGTFTNWRLYGSRGGLYIDVDTSWCKFATMPQFVVAIVGTLSHWKTQV
jgi:hypothetical protein